MTDDPLPLCTCHHAQDHHDDDCPWYLELLARMRAYRKEET